MSRKSAPDIPRSQPERSKVAPLSQKNRKVLSQSVLNEINLSQSVDFNEAVNNCVRYVVFHSGENANIRKVDIQKIAAPNAGQHFQKIIEKAEEILRNVYGLNLIVCDATQNTAKSYLVCNALPFLEYNDDEEEIKERKAKNIFLTLILSHILMSNSSVTEDSIYSFLKMCQIDISSTNICGNIKDYINKTLVTQKYLKSEMDMISHKNSFTWGIRAEKEISKHNILKFVSQMFNNKPKSYTQQFKEAEEQAFENHQLIENEENAMDVD